MSAIASFLTVMALSLLVARVATVALTLTGVSREVARFQARSALTGTGYTTTEAETIVGHPVRRRIVMYLMVLRNAGLVTAVSSFILSFTGAEDATAGIYRALFIAAGIGVLWLVSLSELFDRWLSAIIRRALNRWTHLEVRDYARLLDLAGEYSIKELRIGTNDWLAGKTLGESRLQEEGILLLGIRRKNGKYIGAPFSKTEFRRGDLLVIYGADEAIASLNRRGGGEGGDAMHERAIAKHEKREQDEHASDAC